MPAGHAYSDRTELSQNIELSCLDIANICRAVSAIRKKPLVAVHKL